jgi:uncharacterized protein YkwD
MGRHRRVSHAPEPVVTYYDATALQRSSHRRPTPPTQRGGFSARAGILGASAAMAMGAVAVASTVVPHPGGSSGTQYSDVEAGGPPDQSSSPNVPAPSGGSSDPGAGDSGSGSGNVPPDTSQTPGNQNQDPGNAKPSQPGAGGNSKPSDASGNGKGTGGSGKGSGSSAGSESGSRSASTGGSAGGTSRPVSKATRDEAEVLSLVNNERDDAGCKPLKASKDLAEMAGDFSKDMAVEDFFSHLAPDGSSPWDRAEGLGVLDLGGENIARGQDSPKEVMDDWMRSPSHKANILNCEYRTMGVGAYLDDDDGPWWTQDFGY